MFILAIGLQSEALGQCDYDTCALRIKYGWSTKLVAGTEEREITGLGMFPSSDPIELLGERSDLAASLYQDFRSQQATGSILILGGLAMLVGSVFAAPDNQGLGAALAFGGLGIMLGGSYAQMSAHNKASMAVWEYNRTFAK